MTPLARVRGLLGSRVARNAGAAFVAQMTAYAAPLVVVPYLSRVLSPEHYGLIAFARSFNYYFVTLVEYGFNLTATRRIAGHCNDPERVARITSSVYAAKGLLTIFGFGLMIAIAFSIPQLRSNLLLLCITYLAVLGDLLFPLWLFQGLQKMENLLWRDLCAKLLSLALIFVFVHKDGDYLRAAAIQAGSTVVAGLIGLGTVPFALGFRWVPPSWDETLGALREGWPVFLSMASFTLTSATSVLFLEFKGGPRDVAYFAVANRLVTALRGLVDPVMAAIYPHVSTIASRSREEAVLFLRKYALALTVPFLLTSLVLLVFAPPIIHLFAGPKYSASFRVLEVLAFSPFLLAFQHSYSTLFMLPFGFEKQWSRIVVQSAFLHFAVLIPLMFSIWPPLAVAWAGILLDGFMGLMTYLFYRSHC
jgi:PST family polysaccharide transporter